MEEDHHPKSQISLHAITLEILTPTPEVGKTPKVRIECLRDEMMEMRHDTLTGIRDVVGS